MMKRLLKNPVGLLGCILVTIVFAAALLAPVLAKHKPTEQPYPRELTRPSLQHWLGTDAAGRDVATRLLYGARTTLWIAAGATAIALAAGTFLGIVAAMAGGILDAVIQRATDFLLSFPAILLGLFLLAFLPRNSQSLIIAVGVAGIPTVLRQMRAAFLSERAKEYVLAARSVGAGSMRIAFREILPNCLSLLMVLGSLQLGSAVLESAGLAFLGLSGEPDMPEWGLMLQREQSEMFAAPRLVIAPGIAIAVTVLGFNLLSDGLRDALAARR
jgi:peptide/nickel transport system permease protein